jgi:hypothetical protein
MVTWRSVEKPVRSIGSRGECARPGIALSAIEALQGVASGRVVTVLGVSISLALLGIVVAFLVAFKVVPIIF